MKHLELSRPLLPNQVEWRQQSVNPTGLATVVPYIDNRAVMERFDEVFGWANWESNFLYHEKGFLCTLTITLPDGRRVSKQDGANPSDIESFKGGISDAMKRCAVQFGMGRDLYSYPRVYIQLTDKEKGANQKYYSSIPYWAKANLDVLVQAIHEGTYDGKEIVKIETGTRLSYAKTPPAEKPAAKPATKRQVAEQMKTHQQAAASAQTVYLEPPNEDSFDLPFDLEDAWKDYIARITDHEQANVALTALTQSRLNREVRLNLLAALNKRGETLHTFYYVGDPDKCYMAF